MARHAGQDVVVGLLPDGLEAAAGVAGAPLAEQDLFR
jgi:hypothetical protein